MALAFPACGLNIVNSSTMCDMIKVFLLNNYIFGHLELRWLRLSQRFGAGLHLWEIIVSFNDNSLENNPERDNDDSSENNPEIIK